MLIIGIDPGLSGSLASVDHNGLHHVIDIPIMQRSGRGFVKHQVNASGLKKELQAMMAVEPNTRAVIVYIELVNAMAGQGRASISSLGFTCGVIEGVVCAMGMEHRYVTPRQWKGHFKIDKIAGDKGAGKEMARALAQRYYPDADLHRKADHNKAEAILIARYGYEQEA